MHICENISIFLALSYLFSSLHDTLVLKLGHFHGNLPYFLALQCGPQSLFYILRASKTIFFAIRPVYSFEFETPDLNCKIFDQLCPPTYVILLMRKQISLYSSCKNKNMCCLTTVKFITEDVMQRNTYLYET